MNEINFQIEDIEKIDLSMDVGVKEIFPPIENLEVNPSKEQQVFNHENSYGYDEVIVNPIPDEYIIPDGTLEVAENGDIDVTAFKMARVGVYTPPNLQDKEVTPTKEIQTITSDEGYDGLNQVTVNPISDEYIIPSETLEITENGTYDVKEYAEVETNIPTGGVTPEKGFIVTKWTDDGYAEEVEVVGLTSLPAYCFSAGGTTGGLINAKVNKIILPNDVAEIGLGSFGGCSKLVDINLSDTVITSISNGAFQNCTSLKIDKLLDSVETIRSMGFYNCPSLIQLSMNGIKTLTGSSASNGSFWGCTGLKAVWIGDSITTFPRYVFYKCTNLEKIYINLPRATVETLSGYSYAFMNNADNIGIIVCNDDEGFITKEEFDAIDWSTI